MSKGKAQRGIRESIQLLSSILTECDFAKLPSEAFRQAKFNNEVARRPFWGLLLHTVRFLQQLDTSTGGGTLKLGPEVVAKQESFHLQAFVVHKYFFAMGYCRCEFMSSPAKAIGSRELLLAFGWLLCKSELIPKLTRRHLQAANEVKFPSRTTKTFLLDQIEVDARLMDTELQGTLKELEGASTSSHCILQNLQKLVWLRGRMLKAWEMALDSNLAYHKTADRLHRCTLRSHTINGPSHLNVHEVFLLRHPEEMTLYLAKLEHHISVVRKLLEWRELEAIFWQWLESVLALQQSERSREPVVVGSDESCGKSAVKLESKQIPSTRVERMEKELTELLLRNQPHIDRISRLWQLKQRQCQPQRQEMDVIRSTITAQLHPFTTPTAATTNLQTARQSTAIVEHLTPLDTAVCIQEPTVRGGTHRAALPSLAAQQQEAEDSLLKASRGALTLAQSQLADVTGQLQILQSDLLQQLHVLEKRLPESVCKIEHTQ